jgi:nucleotidyltransferase/DNA polymerase involved in DNA repair
VIVAHMDLDAFYAAVEELENPELRSQPLIVGGDPRGRGVVATANYAARRFGIHSAMSAAEAIRRCPHAVFVRPRHSLYREYSRAVWSTVRGIVPTVEQTGIDEGYLDVGEVARDFLEARVVAVAMHGSPAVSSSSCPARRRRSSRSSTCAACRASGRRPRHASVRRGSSRSGRSPA